MATNKKAQIRYQVLDKCFRNSGRRYFIKDLMNECSKVLTEIDPKSIGICRRQIFDDIAFMESSEGWSIDLVRNRLLTSLQTISQFKGMPQFEWMYELLPKLTQGIPQIPNTIMEFDNNQDLTGIEHIGTIYNAILYKKVLQIDYSQSFESRIQLIIHPYYLKQYNNRWFLFGYNPERDKYDWNLPLDRIMDISEIQKMYTPNAQIDWNEYFDDMIGVTKPEGSKPEIIILHFYGKTGHYISSKPIHSYQKHRWLNSEILEVNLELIINYELERFILSYADSVKVIQPDSLAEKVKERMKLAHTQYYTS